MTKTFEFKYATVVDHHDGDTFYVDIDMGFRIKKQRQSVRLAGCNAIELDDPGGVEARNHLISLLPLGSACEIKSLGYDKYGDRIDAFVGFEVTPGLVRDVASQMVLDGFAASWDGTGPRPTPPWPIP